MADNSNAASFSNDGSFMQQFMKKYEKPKVLPDPNQVKEQEKKAEEAEEKRKLEEERKLQQEREELKAEQKRREEMVQKLIADQKKHQESGPANQLAPKARKQPFQSKSSSTPRKRKEAPPRSKPAMPVTKKQKTSVHLPRYKARVIPPLEPPKPPPLDIKMQIDAIAESVVENGLRLEEEIINSNTRDRKFAFLFDKESPEFKYYEHKKEQLCEEKGIILAKTNLEQSESVRALNEKVKVFSVLYKDLEKKLEEEDRNLRSNVDYESIYAEDTPKDEQDGKFMQKLSSHYTGAPDDAEYQSTLVSNGNKGAMLLKNMGWTEGWLRLTILRISHEDVYSALYSHIS
mmetsp:Transcript_20792/g.26291  ORF Transcript_20792/g.26291 Transcript_20792/m.26291 type:complete len:346 (-) Transcript_20792:247-1284(-)